MKSSFFLLAFLASGSLARWAPFIRSTSCTNSHTSTPSTTMTTTSTITTRTTVRTTTTTTRSPISTTVTTTTTPIVRPLSTATTSSTTTTLSTSILPATTCLTGAQVTSIVNRFISLLEDPKAPTFTAVANTLLADNFTDTSDSINFIAGIPLGSVTFPSKQAFIVGQGSQHPIGNVTTLGLFYTCRQIAWRWVAQGVASGQYQVKGINTFDINGQGQIVTIYTEFNSAAWLADYGNPQCT